MNGSKVEMDQMILAKNSIQNGNIEELRNKTIKELFQILRIPWIKLPLLLIDIVKYPFL